MSHVIIANEKGINMYNDKTGQKCHRVNITQKVSFHLVLTCNKKSVKKLDMIDVA